VFIVPHFLLIPGTAFITEGARVMSHDLTPHINGFNHVLPDNGGLLLRADMIPIFFSLGSLTQARPAAFFTALDHGANVSIEGNSTLLIDEMRGHFFTFSREIAIILLIM